MEGNPSYPAGETYHLVGTEMLQPTTNPKASGMWVEFWGTDLPAQPSSQLNAAVQVDP